MSKELKACYVVASSETENYINGETNLAFEAYDAGAYRGLQDSLQEQAHKERSAATFKGLR